jgi:hypothetical protein
MGTERAQRKRAVAKLLALRAKDEAAFDAVMAVLALLAQRRPK